MKKRTRLANCTFKSILRYYSIYCDEDLDFVYLKFYHYFNNIIIVNNIYILIFTRLYSTYSHT